MQDFDLHSLEVLEYFKIISILKGLCVTAYGIDNVERVAPGTDIEAIRERLDEVSEMKDIILFGDAIPLYRLDDGREMIRRSRTEGIHLDPASILRVRELIDLSSHLHDYAKSEREHFPLIEKYLAELHPFPEIKKEIDRAIDKNGEILDSASQKLKRIRMDLYDLKRKITGRLSELLAQRHKTPGWQDDTITVRDGRYVIPVIAGQFQSDSGIIHDRSKSGSTLFVEPNAIVEANNRLGQLFQDEQLEIDRILRHLTTLIGEAADRLLANCEIIGILDSIHASANLSIKIGGNKPLMSKNSKIELIKARHPLMAYRVGKTDDIVPNDFSLNDSRLAMIITGPNTGGKTVALKTVGLLVLMAQSGLHIPTEAKSEIGIFNSVIADIGDEQSIELSLSTFSSHVRQIIFAVRNARESSLILLDEIGAGTDPKEGSALAEAIILKMVELKAKLIVTTHYSQLKTLPMIQPEIENASFEFDRESLAPTFKLYTGIPGGSYAVEIAQRLGMPRDIAAHAANLIGKSERSLTGLIESLEKDLSVLKKDKVELEEKLRNAANLENHYNEKIEKLEKEIDEIKKRQLEELERTLNETRSEVERIVKEIRESKASTGTVKQAHKFLQEKKETLERLKAKHQPKPAPSDKLEPGDPVLVISLRAEGEFVGMAGDNKGKVRVGNIMSTVDITDLKKIITDASDKKLKSAGGLREMSAPGPEIDLRGMTVEEARESLDKFLDSAMLSGLQQLYVIHGKGTGKLRKELTEFLKRHSAVDSIRLGDWNEGGAGVTVVKLR
ncbi:MAG: hypothetical protein CVT49_11695 [candidate division Zixibacteria bacterium HGW-Zixibacteria-1]|nr:MAG: hypothetical protein CVT49_11695 [candidate division Zixibacteria bacterium HGW-Zixibacteria-1]